MSTKEEKVQVANENVNLDRILIDEIGQFGRFQAKNLAVVALMVIFVAWSASEYIFTTARISTRCLIPECDNEEPQFSPPWIHKAVPASGSSFDNCQRFENTSHLATPGTCPPELFNQNIVRSCDDFVYENTHTVVYDFDLACNEWQRSMIGSLRTIGALTALPITGYISDRWGRKVALIFSGINTAWLGAVRYFADTYIGFVISEFVEATFGSGVFSTAYILVMEVVGPKYRVMACAIINTFFAIGQMSMGLIAWGVPNWRNLTLALYLPQFVVILYFWLINESVRWYMSKGRYEESEALLQKIASTNRRTLSPKSLEGLRHTAEEEKKKKLLEEQDKSEWLIIPVFRHKTILLRCLVSPICWMTNTFLYYGLSINAVYLSGNHYLNYVYVYAVEIPGYWTAVFLMARIGRKFVLIAASWVCAACQIAYIFIPNDHYAASLTVYLIGKYCIAMATASLYVYTAELYPTKYRHSLFAFSSMIGRIGSILAPLTPAFGAATFDEMPFVLFGGFALLAGALVFTTPETLGTKLPDTMEDAENLRKNMRDCVDKYTGLQKKV